MTNTIARVHGRDLRSGDEFAQEFFHRDCEVGIAQINIYGQGSLDDWP
jgi:hypothetical protein